MANSLTHGQEGLFEQVFKKKSTSIVTLPVKRDGVFLGELKVKVVNTDSIEQFDKIELEKMLQPIIEKKVADKIFAQEGLFLNINALKNSGITLSYDIQNLVINIAIDNSLLKVKETNLAFNERPQWAENAVMPKGLSGYINLFNYYQHERGDTNDSIYTGDQNYSFSYNKWALFAQSSYQSDQKRKFTRQDIRLSYDDTKKLTRYQFGDLRYNTELYQNFIPAGGFMVSSNFNLNPYRLFNPTSNREITLENPSTVRVFVNSILIKTIKLPAGRHSIEDLPLNEGLNDVTLEILDNRGRQEKISFERFTSYRLVKKGVHNFTYAFGKTSQEEERVRNYSEDDREYFYLANHIWSASEMSNIGFNINGTKQQNTTGIIARLQSRVGLSELNFTRSQLFKGTSDVKGSGFAARMTQQLYDYSERRRFKNIQFSLEYLSPKFTQMGTTTFNHYASVIPELSYNQFLTDTVSVRLGARYRYNSKDVASSLYTINTGFSAQVNRNYQVTTQYNYSNYKIGSDEHQVLFTLNYFIPRKGEFLTASYNSLAQESNLNWAYNGRARPGQWNSRLNVTNAPGRERYEVDIERNDQWYNAAIGHDMSRGSRELRQNNTNVNFHTGIAFAGGNFAISRPIGESFIMIKTNEALKEVPLYINRNDEFYTAGTAPFSSAVIPDTQSYRFYPLRLDTRNVPIGVQSPKSEYVFMPPFRGGTLLELSSKLNRAIVGKLRDERGPMGLIVGHLQRIGQSDVKIPFFTNRKGRFLIESIELGEYHVIVNKKEYGKVSVDNSGDGFILWENK